MKVLRSVQLSLWQLYQTAVTVSGIVMLNIPYRYRRCVDYIVCMLYVYSYLVCLLRGVILAVCGRCSQ